jgi:predicted glycosyltransferase
MRSERKDGRILIYSHDTFGLGHLRRCRAIAHSLVENFKHLSVLILCGRSPRHLYVANRLCRAGL